MITGVAATTVGLPAVEAVILSMAVYSPLVILTAFNLLDVGSPLAVVVLGSLVVGARFSVLSLSPYLERLSTRWKWVLAYFLLTPAYVLSVERFESEPETDERGFYLGTAIPGWITLQLTFVLGIWLGASVSSGWQLDFVLPLAFIALLVRFLSDRAGLVTALAAGVTALLTTDLPLGTGLLVAIVGGVEGSRFGGWRWSEVVERAADEGLVWTLIVLVGVGTFALRLSFIQLRPWVDEFPAVVERSLAYLPEAVLAALVFPALFAVDGTVAGVANPRVLAAGLAAVAAWRTCSMVATIAVGMGVLWVATFLLV